MEIATLFTEQKWNIFKLLSQDKLSPLQLAQKSNTTIANISQQLKLLEAVDLVKKEKIKNREKGQPRTLFSISNDYAYLVFATNDFAEKKLLVLNDYDKFLLRTLFLENAELHYYLSKFYWKIEDYLELLDMIIVMKGGDEIEIALVAEKAKEIEKKINITQIKKPNGETKSVKILAFTKEELIKLVKQGKAPFSPVKDLQVIHDPKRILSDLKKQEVLANN